MKKCRLATSLMLSFLLTAHVSPRAGADDGYLHLNKVIDKLERGKLVTGIWCLSRSLSNARSIVGYNGYPSYEESLNRPMIDFLVVAMEHYPYDISALRAFTLGLTSRREVLAKGNLQPNCAIFVRLPVEGADPVHAMIKQALDVGAHGVVIPHVRTADEASKIIRACRFVRPLDSPYLEPEGDRGFSPAICSYLWGVTSEEYYERADTWPLNPQGDIMAIVMIEDREGVANVDDIVRVPGIGAVFFGSADYTVSAGRYGDPDFDVDEALETVKRACDRADVPFVGFANADTIAELGKEKNRMLIIGSDIDHSGRVAAVLDYLCETMEQ